MNRVQFLLDENLPRALAGALRRRDPRVDVRRVGQPQMPAIGTPDSELLRFCEQTGRILVSRDRASMPQHVTNHIATGAPTHGVLLATNRCTLANMTEDLLLIWMATKTPEWENVLQYLPLSMQ